MAPICGAAALIASACGGASGAGDDTLRPRPANRARYLNDAHLSAMGEGATPAEAERAARVGVAEQVRAQLHSVCEVSDAEGTGGPTHRTACDVRSETRFERAELIKLVADESRCPEPGRCVAFAVLDRAQAIEVLSAGHSMALAAFAAAADRAQAEADRPEPDDRALSTALQDAAAALTTSEAQVGPLAALEGRLPASQRAARVRALTLDALRDRRLGQLRVQLDLSGVEAGLRAPVGQALVQAFAHLGLTARTGDGRTGDVRTGDACTAGLRFAPQVEVPCGRSPLGPRCSLALHGALQTCAGEELSQIDLGNGVQAVHPRSADEARRQLLAALPAAPLAAALHRALAGVLPVRPLP